MLGLAFMKIISIHNGLGIQEGIRINPGSRVLRVIRQYTMCKSKKFENFLKILSKNKEAKAICFSFGCTLSSKSLPLVKSHQTESIEVRGLKAQYF